MCSNLFMKEQIRNFAKQHRKFLDVNSLSFKIQQNLYSLPEFIKSKNIFTYYSFSDEVSTLDIFNKTEKNWFIPKIEQKNLLVCPFNKNNLIENQYKIMEPKTSENNINPDELDMVIIPALAADRNGYRIGYGKGYYDRFLASIKSKSIKATLVFSDLLFDNIYPNEFDIKSDIIITDKEILRINC